jgi:hypothetical protein
MADAVRGLALVLGAVNVGLNFAVIIRYWHRVRLSLKTKDLFRNVPFHVVTVAFFVGALVIYAMNDTISRLGGALTWRSPILCVIFAGLNFAVALIGRFVGVHGDIVERGEEQFYASKEKVEDTAARLVTAATDVAATLRTLAASTATDMEKKARKTANDLKNGGKV